MIDDSTVKEKSKENTLVPPTYQKFNMYCREWNTGLHREKEEHNHVMAAHHEW
jgi:hypothetical protein